LHNNRLAAEATEIVKGRVIITALKKKLRSTSDQALARRLGMSLQAIYNWKERQTVTPRQLAGIVASAGRASARTVETTAIRPLVEFFRIDKCPSKQAKKFELFAAKGHPYLEGLRSELQQHHGVYIFFDSRGQAIYTGKARRQHLWHEMTLAFNRHRGDVQKIKRVRHPTRRQPYRTSDEKTPQIQDHIVPLHELASYFSAYRVADGMINEVEAMLVRSFANDLLNVRIEKFGKLKRKP
jgi:hypothetical protein